MATHWISASKALSILEDAFGGRAMHIALCTRAHLGLVATEARLLVWGNERRENAAIPTSFWWATGHEALNQNWPTGDFSTWIDSRVQCQAFGVRFSLDGLRDMLEPTMAATIARQLSVAGDPEWMAAKAARAFMFNELGAQPVAAGGLLIDQCRLGFIAGRTVQMQRADGGRPDDWTHEAREWDIPSWFWETFTHEGTSSQNWERGVFAGRGKGPAGHCWITLTGVHFARTTLEAMRPAKPPATSEPTVSNASRGRPLASFWDDLWCAVWGNIYRGDLQPTVQAEIERAMLDWATANGHELSETAAKTRARKLFTEYQREGINS